MSIAGHIGALMRRADLPGVRCVVDATGVGTAVLEAIDAACRGESMVHPVVITAGEHPTQKNRYVRCPKTALAGAIRSALESGDLKIAASLEFAEPLKRELLSFETRITRAAHEVFEAKPGEYDDLVIAVALCVWYPRWFEGQLPVIVGHESLQAGIATHRAVTMGSRATIGSASSDRFGRPTPTASPRGSGPSSLTAPESWQSGFGGFYRGPGFRR
jgi:hypothetical protein